MGSRNSVAILCYMIIKKKIHAATIMALCSRYFCYWLVPSMSDYFGVKVGSLACIVLYIKAVSPWSKSVPVMGRTADPTLTGIRHLFDRWFYRQDCTNYWLSQTIHDLWKNFHRQRPWRTRGSNHGFIFLSSLSAWCQLVVNVGEWCGWRCNVENVYSRHRVLLASFLPHSPGKEFPMC